MTSQFQQCKSDIMANISEIDETFMMKIVQAIPETISCQELYDFFDGLLEILLGRFPDQTRQFMPQWLVYRIAGFEKDTTAWPAKCLDLIDMVNRKLLKSQGSNNFCRVNYNGPGVKMLQTMKNQLTMISELKENYNVQLSFDQYNELMTHTVWQCELVKERVSGTVTTVISTFCNFLSDDLLKLPNLVK